MAKSEASKTGPVEFFKQVRVEMKRVTWPTRQETIVSTIAVFIMVTLAAIFLYTADQIIAVILRFIMNLGL